MWRRLHAKVGAGKAMLAVTAAVVAIAGGTTAIVLTTTQKKIPTPVVAVPTATTSSAAPGTPSSSPSALVLDTLTGEWFAHGANLTIKPDGTFTLVLRIYTENGTSVNKNANGGGHLTSAAGGSADGVITESDHTTGDGAIPLGPMHITFSPDTDSVQVTASDEQSWTFCGANAQSGLCGA
ncbi:MAG: hypothetical protein HOV83_34655 [Catenulispora sp.]|nr:hypothetical protein [Catenulispora sp.]